MPSCPFTNAMLVSRATSRKARHAKHRRWAERYAPQNLGLNPGGRPSIPFGFLPPKRVQASEAMSITKRYFTSLLSMRS